MSQPAFGDHMCRNDSALEQFKVSVVASALRASCCTPTGCWGGIGASWQSWENHGFYGRPKVLSGLLWLTRRIVHLLPCLFREEGVGYKHTHLQAVGII